MDIRKCNFVSAKGGTIDFVSLETGELLRSVFVPAGIVDADPYADLCPVGAEMQVFHGLDVVEKPVRNGIVVQTFGDAAYKSAANPDFSPTSAAHQARKLDIMVRQAADRHIAQIVQAKAAQLQSIEVIPDAKPDTVEVVEAVEAETEAKPAAENGQ